MSYTRVLLLSAFIISCIGLAAFYFPAQEIPVQVPQAKTLSFEEQYPHTLKQGTLYASLKELNVDSKEILDIVAAAKTEYDLRRVNSSLRFNLNYFKDSPSELKEIRFFVSPVEIISVAKEEGEWKASKIPVEVQTRVVTYWGVVQDTLWESAERAKMDPKLISELAEIFAWQVDFSREVRANDRWRISVERNFVNDSPIGWGPIVAAEYENQGQTYSAVLFDLDEKRSGYFAPDGSSLKRMFLKSPLRFSRITSRFQRKRFHPVLKINRPHNGVDYAAPTGTPIRAVGDGVLTYSGWQGQGGKTIKIRHNSTYETAYKHLSRFANGIRRGARVQQGQIIGYVGSTGLSTAPHLHFEFLKFGRHVNPLGQSFPSADPVPTHLLTQFQSESTRKLSLLPPWDSTEITLREPATETMSN